MNPKIFAANILLFPLRRPFISLVLALWLLVTTFLSAYKRLHELFQKSSLNNEELTVVWQTINVENDCRYCIPAHTGIAHMMNVDPAIIEARRSGGTLPVEKL